MFTNTAANIAAQRQASMFDEGPEEFALTAPQPKMRADGWIGHPGLMGTTRAGAWTHPALPGVTIKHCGHPTALRPYYVEGLPSIKGRTFSNLSDAKGAARWMSDAPELALQRKGIRLVQGENGQWFHVGPRAGQHSEGFLTQGHATLHAGITYRMWGPL